MTRELNVRITLQERDGHTYTDEAYREYIGNALIAAEYIDDVVVQVETVKPESEKK